MITYNFKFIIFSIILGTLTLIYNNDCDSLCKNTKNKNSVELPNNFRSLVELLHEPRTNHIQENIKLREYRNINERKYEKNKYKNDDTKPNDQIPDISEKENNGTQNLEKYKKEKYNKEKNAKLNRFSRSIKYLEMQRKLYNNFYVKPEIYFQNFSDKSNNKSCECKKNQTYDKLTSSNKVHDKYLDNLKTSCFGAADVCGISTAFVVKCGIGAVKSLPYVKTALSSTGSGTLTGINAFNAVIKSFTYSTVVATFHPYSIAIYIILAIIVVLIILYIWLYRRRKNSWKHECKKHLCT
ncbi:PIR protein,putative [Plasmodium sp.]|nr:PIR protein,putative [Plasmodium sp.]